MFWDLASRRGIWCVAPFIPQQQDFLLEVACRAEWLDAARDGKNIRTHGYLRIKSVTGTERIV
ncbi:hypothetical protein A2U01_0062669 [Trifolium medium]|uniref:Uncharacterized protein n=1 Tax=Trifolium medium TaxID=97028 RepID=A0A392S0S1_9FABA|nr:hypothetical protein [Trifolium medium]